MKLLCACVFLVIFPLLVCEPVMCVSVFLACVLRACFVYGLRIVFARFHYFFCEHAACVSAVVVCVCVRFA